MSELEDAIQSAREAACDVLWGALEAYDRNIHEHDEQFHAALARLERLVRLDAEIKFFLFTMANRPEAVTQRVRDARAEIAEAVK